jgi:hypothetical protein
MDFFNQTQPSCCYLTFFHIPERSIALVKRLAGSPKGAEIDPNLPHANKVKQSKVAHAFYTLMDSFSRTKLCPSRCYLTFFHIPERSIALVKRLAGSPKELKLIPTCPTLTKVLPKHTHSYIHGWTSFSRTKLPKPLLSYLLPYSRTFNCTSKTTGWFTKELKLIPTCPTLTKVLLQGSTRILIYIDGLFSVAPNCAQAVASFFHFPERSIALVKRLVHQRAEIDPNLPHANKVLPKVAHAFLYTLISFQSHQPVPKPLLSYLLPYSRTFNCTSKRLAGSPKGADPNLPHANKSTPR